MAKAKTNTKSKTKGGARKAQARGKQLEVPGTEQKLDPKMHAAVSRLVDASVEEGRARTESTNAREDIAALMKKKKLTTYLDPKLKVRVEIVKSDAVTRVKMKSLKERDGDGGEDDVEAHEVDA